MSPIFDPTWSTAETQRQIWRNIFLDLKSNGKLVSPRSKEVLEIENYSYQLPPYVRFCSLEPRNLKLDYIKQETRWFLRGDPYDLSICNYSNIWQNIIVDGKLNSNYGYAWFTKGGLDFVVSQLIEDKDSRRASAVIVEREHLSLRQKDVPCTAYLNFRIRQDCLNMSVRMRSQDSIFGMGNDAPAFSFLQEMIYNLLLPVYPDLRLGYYHHTADSFHIYSRHYEMLEKLITEDVVFIPIDFPKISGPEEVKYLLSKNISKQSVLDPKP